MIAQVKECYMKFVSEVCEILGIGKPADILRLCAVASEFEKEIREQAFAAGKEYERAKQGGGNK